MSDGSLTITQRGQLAGPHDLAVGYRPVPRPRAADDSTEQAWSPRRWAALAVLLTGAFMDLLDTTIVNVAIPSMRGSLDASFSSVQWILAGYLLAVAVGLITFSRLGDLVGRRRVFLGGVFFFGVTSLVSGLATNPTVLVGSRVAQGLAAAAMIPQILAIIQVTFPPREQPKALALYSTTAGLAVMSGPLAAGLLLTVFDLTWRWIFLINVPIAMAVVVATILLVPESKSRGDARPDLGGAALVSAGLFGLVFGLIQGRELGWPLPVVALICASPVLLGVFACYENRRHRIGGSTLVSPTLFTQRPFMIGLSAVLVLFSGMVGFFLAFTLFLQLGLGYSPLKAALTMLPNSIGLVVVSLVSTKLAPRPSRAMLATGALLMGTAVTGLIVMLSKVGTRCEPWDVWPIILFFGCGMGLTVPTLAGAITERVDERDAGAASGVINSGLQVGNAVGVAIIGVIMFGVIGSHASISAKAQATTLTRGLVAIGVTSQQARHAVTGFKTCFVDTSNQKDTAAVPQSCEEVVAGISQARRAAARRVVGEALVAARKDNFVAAIGRALLYDCAVFAVSFVLLFGLPGAVRVVGRHRASRRPLRRNRTEASHRAA